MTPADYEPTGFKSCPFESFVFKNGELCYDAGQLQTVWHGIMVEIRADESIVKDRLRVINDTISSINSLESTCKLLKESLNDREIDYY